MAHPWIAVGDAVVTRINSGSYTDFTVEAKRDYRAATDRTARGLQVYVMPVNLQLELASRAGIMARELTLGLIVRKPVHNDHVKGKEEADKLMGLVDELQARVIAQSFASYKLTGFDGDPYDTEAFETQDGLFLSQTDLILKRVN